MQQFVRSTYGMSLRGEASKCRFRVICLILAIGAASGIAFDFQRASADLCQTECKTAHGGSFYATPPVINCPTTPFLPSGTCGQSSSCTPASVFKADQDICGSFASTPANRILGDDDGLSQCGAGTSTYTQYPIICQSGACVVDIMSPGTSHGVLNLTSLAVNSCTHP